MDKLNTIAERVAYARSTMGWNQTELATEIGIRAQAIQQIEDGKTKRSRYLPDIAEACQVPFNWILKGGKLPKNTYPIEQKTTPPEINENTPGYSTSETIIGREISEIVTQVLDILAREKFITINNINTKNIGEIIGFAFNNRAIKSAAESTKNVIDYLKFVSSEN